MNRHWKSALVVALSEDRKKRMLRLDAPFLLLAKEQKIEVRRQKQLTAVGRWLLPLARRYIRSISFDKRLKILANVKEWPQPGG